MPPRVTMYSARSYDRESFDRANFARGFEIVCLEDRLDLNTAALAAASVAACLFVNDNGSREPLERLAAAGVRLILLRSAGFNHVDLEAARELGMRVAHVPAYSPNAVAEHTLALILSLNRQIPRAYNRVRDLNFSLDGLVGFDLEGKTAGVIGTGRVGALVARLLWHFRCRTIAHDLVPDASLGELGVEYVDLPRLWAEADLISLNAPLTPETHHLVRAETIAQMKPGVMLVNTGRGALIDAAAAVEGLKAGRIGALALDVYEEEQELFFADRSLDIVDDDVFARLLTFPNVLITAHQGFLTREALAAIAETTLRNLADLVEGKPCPNELTGRERGPRELLTSETRVGP